MEGLEISEIQLLELERTSRLDSEFYSKENIKVLTQLSGIKNESIASLVRVSDGNHMSISSKFQKEGIPYYRGQNISSFFIEDSDPICIDEHTYSDTYLKRSHLQKGDVLLSIVGTIGGVSIVSTNKKATCNCKLAILRPKDINGFYLSAFLKSKYGQNQIHKFKRGAVQMGLILEDMNQIFVPTCSDNFQKEIENLVITSKEKSDKSKSKYKDAENLLLNEIGINDFTQSEEGINIKRLSNSFRASGRLDAEYYQPKFDEVMEKIKSQTYDRLLNLVEITKSIEPGSMNYTTEDNGLPFMRVADFSKNGLTTPQKYLSSTFVSENYDKIQILKPKKGIILFSKDGSVGTAYHLRKDFNGITSGAILHLKVRDKSKIIPEYLTLALNSKVVQMQAERDAGGSIILHWRVSEIENVLVPIIDFYKQQSIAALVEESFKLKKESEQLLEISKTAVEMAIEKSETEALEFIASF